ncbi:hypothetical protein VTL71DRAFT_9341 [Oculimacula yallundae]|uniref:Uncharacterized protein n=1 Tax=Oculimacula yallundae TaxID=86028 RepID=A0ABR4BST1_9HELO
MALPRLQTESKDKVMEVGLPRTRAKNTKSKSGCKTCKYGVPT